MTDEEQIVLNKFEKYVYENVPSNDFLVQICELSGKYLNLQTISNYAKNNGKSYNGVKKFRQKINLFGVKFIIDNK
jgi:hypothetical protein